ncbi:hypothetical protein M513_04608 [Trichuris suis]|uniref:Uncharacterized protein n=1 Tax=Trichuris suis TaxID=68888 RepID=A0A085MB65_9BILA|nr:hypothetical protein M513_04608 [Trichuris suis]
MSWILNLKEKAENLLDHIDDVAATALQKPVGNTSFYDDGRDVHHASLSNGPVNVLAKSDVLVHSMPLLNDGSSHKSRIPVNMTDNMSDSRSIESKSHSRNSSMSNGYLQIDGASKVGAIGSASDDQNGSVVIAFDKAEDGLDRIVSDVSLPSLEAKDHQIAILRLRIQELESSLSKSEALIRSADTKLANDQEIENLRHQLHILEAVLSEERKSFEDAKAEYLSRIQEVEKENVAVLEKLAVTNHELNEQKLCCQQSSEQLALVKFNLESCKQEFEEYKVKATRILQAKESTITALKQDSGEMDSPAQMVSFEELRAERDILKEELEKTVTSLNKLKADVQNSESQRMADQRASMQKLHQLEEELQSSRLNSSHYRLQLRQLEQEAKGATEEVNNLQRTLQVKLQEKDAEIKRLSREIIAVPSKTESETETEQRLKQVMESLIKKQNMIESLQTDKHSLMLQLERVEHMYREAESAAIRATYNSQNQGAHNGSPTPICDTPPNLLCLGNRLRVPSFLNGTLGKGILKQMDRFCYGVDTIMGHCGIMFRRYPMARFFFLTYAVVLHLWVAFVLLTYTPEMHTVDGFPRPST